jgi:hypothetical protein
VTSEPNYKMMLLNLLAVIHGDGGHHTMKVGLDQSVRDANQRVPEMMAVMDALVNLKAAMSQV